MAGEARTALTTARAGTPAASAAGRVGRRPSRGAIGTMAGLLALGVVWAIVQASDVPLTMLNEIHGEALRVYGVGGVYVEDWVSGEYNPFEDGRLSASTVVVSPVFMAAVMAIGLPLVRALPGSDGWPAPVEWIAAFLPGYLMVIAPLHLIMSAIPLPAGPAVGLTAVPAAALLLHRRAVVAWARAPRLPHPDRATLWAGAAVAGGIGVALVHRLQAGRNFMVPDSGVVLVQLAEQTRVGGVDSDYLAHWDQQADEWIFNAPLMFFREGVDYLLPLYLTQVLAMVSFAVLLGGVAWALAPRRRMLCAVAVPAVVLMATPVADPRYYVSLWGGQTPAMWLGHPGRELAIVVPWALLLVICRGAARRPPTWAVALGVLGLAFVSVHAIAFALVPVAGALVWRALVGRRAGLLGGPRGDAVLVGCAVVALLAPLAVFALVPRVGDPDPLALGLFAGALVGIGAAVALALGAPRPEAGAAAGGLGVRTAVTWLGVLVAGLLLSGNMTSDLPGVRSALGLVLPGYDATVVSRGLLGPNPLAALDIPTFTGQECWITAHCTGGPGYLTGFGVMSVAALAGFVALAGIGGLLAPRVLRAAWLVSAALLCLGFVLVDWSGSAQGTAWIFTRFVEVPYYGLLGLSVVALLAARSVAVSRAAIAAVAVWTLVPFVSNATPEQWVTNVEYLAGLL